MNEKTKNFLSFAAGVAIGVGAMYYYFKIKDNTEEPIEVDEPVVVENQGTDEEVVKFDSTKSMLDSVKKETKNKEKTQYSKTEKVIDEHIKEIEVNEYGRKIGEYDISLIKVYEDDVAIEDGDDSELTAADLDMMVGMERYYDFLEGDKDNMYIQNDRLKMQYELTKEPSRYRQG